MAEIRKFDPARGNAIAEALKAAMGEPVRPAQPGARPEPVRAATPAEPPAPPAVVTFNIKTVIVPAEEDD